MKFCRYSIRCLVPVGWIKRQRNPTHLLGFILIAPRTLTFHNLTYKLRLFPIRTTALLIIIIKMVFLPVSVTFFLAGDGKNSTPLRVNIIY
jgi:hypothetical protein